jgi:hypothetical protein
MQDKISFLKRRHVNILRAVENLEHNRNAFEDFADIVGEFKEIQDRIDECLSEVRAIRTAIDDKIIELEGAS